MENNQIDSIDREIIESLKDDARKSYLQVAKDLGVSNSMVHQRIGRLKKLDIITKEKLSINPKELGFDTCSFAYIELREPVNDLRPVADQLEKIPEIVECNHISGSHTLLVKIYCKNNNHLRIVLYDKIHQIPGVVGTNTFISFETAFKREVPIFEHGL